MAGHRPPASATQNGMASPKAQAEWDNDNGILANYTGVHYTSNTRLPVAE